LAQPVYLARTAIANEFSAARGVNLPFAAPLFGSKLFFSFPRTDWSEMTVAEEHICCCVELLERASDLARVGKRHRSEDLANEAGMCLERALASLTEEQAGLSTLGKAAAELQAEGIFELEALGSGERLAELRVLCEVALTGALSNLAPRI
jgi:hypothetical protein